MFLVFLKEADFSVTRIMSGKGLHKSPEEPEIPFFVNIFRLLEWSSARKLRSLGEMSENDG